MGETAVDLLADPPSHVQDARELPLAGGLVRNLPVLKGPVHGGEEGEDLFVLLPLSDLKDKRLHVVHVVGRVEDGAVVRCKGPHIAADEGAGEGHLLQRGGGVLALHFWRLWSLRLLLFFGHAFLGENKRRECSDRKAEGLQANTMYSYCATVFTSIHTTCAKHTQERPAVG